MNDDYRVLHQFHKYGPVALHWFFMMVSLVRNWLISGGSQMTGRIPDPLSFPPCEIDYASSPGFEGSIQHFSNKLHSWYYVFSRQFALLPSTKQPRFMLLKLRRGCSSSPLLHALGSGRRWWWIVSGARRGLRHHWEDSAVDPQCIKGTLKNIPTYYTILYGFINHCIIIFQTDNYDDLGLRSRLCPHIQTHHEAPHTHPTSERSCILGIRRVTTCRSSLSCQLWV